jgi:hypothetical protein
MAYLVANLSSGKGTWAHLTKVIEDIEWQAIFLITDDLGKDGFKSDKKIEFITIDKNKHTTDMIEDIYKKLKGKIKDTEVALNMISGEGKEHMATLSALLKLGLGIRLMAYTKDGVKEI